MNNNIDSQPPTNQRLGDTADGAQGERLRAIAVLCAYTGRCVADLASEEIDIMRNALDAVLNKSQPPRDPPRCPKCGYTNEDCRTLMDHHLCGEPEPPPPSDAVAPVAWLIEQQGEPAWLTVRARRGKWVAEWTKDANEAVRFSRKDDAMKIGALLDRQSLGLYSVTEHAWIDAPPHAAVNPAASDKQVAVCSPPTSWCAMADWDAERRCYITRDPMYAHPKEATAAPRDVTEPTADDAKRFNDRLCEIAVDEWPSNFEIHATLGYFGYALTAPPSAVKTGEGAE